MTNYQEKLSDFADKQGCLKGCEGCPNITSEGCNHPNHPANIIVVKQDILIEEEVSTISEPSHQNIKLHEPAPVMEMVSCAHHHGGRQTISILDASRNYDADDFFCKDCKRCEE